MYLPQDGHWLASFDVIPPPPQKLESNTTRAARAAQGCTDDSVRMGAGSLMCE